MSLGQPRNGGPALQLCSAAFPHPPLSSGAVALPRLPPGLLGLTAWVTRTHRVSPATRRLQGEVAASGSLVSEPESQVQVLTPPLPDWLEFVTTPLSEPQFLCLRNGTVNHLCLP